MSNSIKSSALHERLNRQYRLLSIEREDLQPALDYIREQLAGVIGLRSLSNIQDMNQLCRELDDKLKKIMPVKKRNFDACSVLGGIEISSLDKRFLRNEIKKIRQKMSTQLQSEVGWDRQRFDRLRQLASQKIGKDIGPDPSEVTDEQILQQQIPEATKIAFRNMVEDWNLDIGLIYQLLSDLYPGFFQQADDAHLHLLSEHLGTCTQSKSPLVLADLPPEILTRPDVAWFREILFNAKRDKLLPIFAHNGVEKVWDELNLEMAAINAKAQSKLKDVNNKDAVVTQQEHALKRQFVNAMGEYFLEIEEMKVPASLRREIKGRQYPDRQQKTAAYETLRFGGRLFNGGKTGSGKTGSIIYTIALGMDEGTIQKTLIQCPACILSEWRLALSDDSEFGYFNQGYLKEGDVIFIDGFPEERPEQWELAKSAKIVVMGIEMSRTKTTDISHKELLKGLNADMYVLDEAHRTRNTSKKADISDDIEIDEENDSEQNEDVEQKMTDMSIVYEVSRRSPYRIFSSATVVTNTINDLVAPTICLNSEPPNYKCDTIPPEHRLVLFDRFLAAHALETDREILQGIPPSKIIPHKNILSWDDIPSLRQDIISGGRQCPRKFLPYFYRPPKEACVPLPEYPPPYIDIFPLSLSEEATCEAIRNQEELSASEKMRLLIRTGLHPYALPDSPETGSSMFQRAKHWLDQWFQDGIRHAVVISPLYTKGMTQLTDHNPSACFLEQLREEYGPQGVTTSGLDGKESRHKLQKTPSKISGKKLTKTQAIIEEFANTDKGILLAQKDVIGIGINEFARAGISHVIVCGSAWTKAEIDQLFGRFARPGQLAQDVCFVILLAEGFLVAMYKQAEMKALFNEIFLTGRIPTKEQLKLFNEKPSQQPISIQTKTQRERFTQLCHLMAGNGRRFIETSPHADEFVELYNLNWEESFNGNVLRMVGGVAEQRIAFMQKSQATPIRIADDGAGTFGFHRTMMYKPGLEIHSSDLQPKMVADSLGRAILNGHYNPELVHPGWPVDSTGYADESMNMRVTSLVLDCLAHGEKPKKAGREMIRTFIESNRILMNENGEWVITLTKNIFKDQKKLQQFLAVFPYFGFEVVPECTGKAKCKYQHLDDDPFEVYVFTVRKIGTPLIDEDMPWSDLPTPVREGLNFRHKKTKGPKKGGKHKAGPKEEKGSYYDDFEIESASGGFHSIAYTADPKRNERKANFRAKKDLLKIVPILSRLF